MKRVMVIGCCGSGKSTLSQKLYSLTGLELIHLDQHYWKPNWVESDPFEWENKVKDLTEKPHWIMDGNYGGTMDLRLKKADTVIYMDFPTWRCVLRVLKRTFKYKGKVRPDMVEGCHERFDLDFLHYVLVFNLIRRKPLLKKLAAFKESLNIVVLKNDKEVSGYLNELDVESEILNSFKEEMC